MIFEIQYSEKRNSGCTSARKEGQLSISRGSRTCLSQECSNVRGQKFVKAEIISLKVPSLGNLRKYTNQRIRRLLSGEFHKLRHFREKNVLLTRQYYSIRFKTFWAISKKEIQKPVCTYLLYTTTTTESKKNVAVIFPRKVPTLQGASCQHISHLMDTSLHAWESD